MAKDQSWDTRPQQSPLSKLADKILDIGEAVVSDPALAKAATLGRFEIGEALRALPSSNAYKGDLGLMTAGETPEQVVQTQQPQQEQKGPTR